MSEKDLIPFNKMTEERQKEIAREGGIASQKKIKERKTMKDQLKLLLSLELKDKKTAENLKKMGVNVDNIDNQMALNVALWAKALQGDVQAFNSIRDTIGEKPKDRVETVISYEEKLKEVVEEDEY